MRPSTNCRSHKGYPVTVTFKVDDVKPQGTPKLYGGDRAEMQFLKQGLARAGIKGDSVEAHKFNAEKITFYDVTQNSFVCTAMKAFSDHIPLAIAPDELWLTVVQAVSKHIELNPEDCRKALVSWEGKKVIEVENTDFFKGSPDNDWEREFGKFSQQIQKAIGKKRDLFDPTFSTTTPTEKAAIQVQMMAALAPYMEYRMMTLCGVPTITLLGEMSDWKAIEERTAAFAEFYPKWAHDPLMKSVSHFVKAAEGKPDLSFWQNFFKRSYGSGGTAVNGWINAFFPYPSNKPNKMMQKNFEEEVLKGPRAGYDVGDYNSSVSVVPMLWDCRGACYDMGLATGIFGTTIVDVGDAKAYKSVIGWVVGEAKEK
jgi:hypothetical protein